MSVGGGLHSFNLTESREGVEDLTLNVRLTQGVAHHVIGVVVDVLVGRAVDIEDVGAPLTGSGEPGLNLDVIIAGSPDCIQGAPQHLAHAGQPEELPANSPPQAKILRKNRYVFNFFIQTLILI
jgi:hypothetical protein